MMRNFRVFIPRFRNFFTESALIFSLFAFFASCSPRILPAQRDTVIQTRIEYIERWRDTIVYVPLPQDSVATKTLDTSSFLAIKSAVSEASVSNGVLHHSLSSNPSYAPEIRYKIKEVEVVRDSIVYVDVETPVEVERELTKLEKARMRIGDFAVVFVLAFLAVWIWRKTRV